ncbi:MULTISPECIES: ABC transporter ATP-binding protein [Polynucleobacter]|uniref:ABC transporter permease subunit n=1 Tax=Polynucleobacter TaxID=44013 RepID=UPI0009ED2811|nr:ABC transporter ATP-binding protein [Polynucleobacter sp. MWH-Post4-6-1]MBU3610868.1 ABC transporter ATP-binding protein [Polynucleobacter wuianus]
MLKRLSSNHLSRSSYLWLGALALILLPWVVGASGGNYWVRVLDFALLYIVLALGLNVVVGFAGLLDLGYIAFYALGAYSYALLASPHLPQHFETIAAAFPQGMHFSPWMVAVFSIILAALFGIILGFPTLQLRGDYLAIVTLGFGEIIRIFMNNLDRPMNLTNGPKGITAIDPIQLFGVSFTKPLDFGFVQVPSLYLVFYLFLILAIAVTIVCLHLQYSRIGRAWVAIREDEIAAKAMGINTRNMKLLAFAIGASFAGVAGVLFSAFQGFVSPESFTLWESIVVLAMVVLGGIGHIPGVILGAIVLAVFPEILRGVAEPVQKVLFGHVIVDVEVIRQLIYGLALILIMLYRPGGIWQKGVDK